jgi:hypothetical protein
MLPLEPDRLRDRGDPDDSEYPGVPAGMPTGVPTVRGDAVATAPCVVGEDGAVVPGDDPRGCGDGCCCGARSGDGGATRDCGRYTDEPVGDVRVSTEDEPP